MNESPIQSSCEISLNSLPCGDPQQFVRPGTTYYPVKTYTTDNTGTPPFNGDRIGDLPSWGPYAPEPYMPVQPWDPFVPQPQRVLPWIPVVPNMPYTPEPGWPGMQLTSLIISTWKMKILETGASFSLDVPGCRAEDVKVQISSRELSAVATRHDDGGISCQAHPFDHSNLDARGAQATVADGVLIVYVPYRAVTAAQTFQVPVTGQ